MIIAVTQKGTMPLKPWPKLFPRLLKTVSTAASVETKCWPSTLMKFAVNPCRIKLICFLKTITKLLEKIMRFLPVWEFILLEKLILKKCLKKQTSSC